MFETMTVSMTVLVSGGVVGLGLVLARYFRFQHVKQLRLRAYVAR